MPSGRSIVIYLRNETYEKIENLIQQRKVSKFVNEAIEEKLEKEKQISEETNSHESMELD